MRILLQTPGYEVCLFQYKRPVPTHQATAKLQALAADMFSSWAWGDEIAAIESGDGMAVLMLVDGPRGAECFL